MDKDTISIIWHIDDVESQVEGLTKDEKREALRRVEKYHDADEGVNWDTIKYFGEQVKEEREHK
jgi:hypothetical protein